MKRKKKVIIAIVAIVVVIAAALGIFAATQGGINPAINKVKSLFGSDTVEVSNEGRYSEDNDTLTTETLKDITYDRYVLWVNDTEDGEGIYYPSDSESTYLTVTTEEVSDEALETLEGENALTYEDVYGILCDNIEGSYANVEEISREMTTVDSDVDAMLIKFYSNKDEDDENTTVYEHWVTVFLYGSNLYYFKVSEPQEVSETLGVEYNVVVTSIICQ